jgi:hypothetical protein
MATGCWALSGTVGPQRSGETAGDEEWHALAPTPTIKASEISEQTLGVKHSVRLEGCEHWIRRLPPGQGGTDSNVRGL